MSISGEDKVTCNFLSADVNIHGQVNIKLKLLHVLRNCTRVDIKNSKIKEDASIFKFENCIEKLYENL